MTKDDIIRSIYGDNPPFAYDTSLPQHILDDIANESVRDWPWPEGRDERRNKVYEIVRMGTVFAYDRKNNGSGLLPFTAEARREIQLSEYAGLIYVPVWEGFEL
jgi:hypothetical protein